MIRWLELSVSPSDFWEEGRAQELNQLHMTSDLITHAYVMNPPLKTQNEEVWRTYS